ncbi:MAG: lysophospholipid acyltransferase family protein [Bacilli bacterium]|nr:lysophospholipid acyltransferase family protein [Bacilli bacterium]MDD4387998.1 lysophospholipid acyltransferase family protein [Bacilli bacterium]
MRIRYGFRYQKYRLPKGPAIILFNHSTNLDPFMVCMSIPGPVYFIATDDIFSVRLLSPLIRYLVAPISKSKAINDIQTIMESLRIVKEGGRIALSPEGNRTFTGELCYVNKAIVKFVRLLKIPLVIHNIIGGFGVHPRFSPHLRKGRMDGFVRKIIMPDEYLDLSDNELYELIIENLSVDELVTGRKYKSKKRAEKMESLFYVCPVCKMISTLYSKENHCYCRHCGLTVEYTEEMTLKSTNPNFTFKTIREWYLFQREFILAIDVESVGTMFSDVNVILKKVIKNKIKKKCLSGRLLINQSVLTVENQNVRKEYPLKLIDSIAILGQNKINFYINNEIYQLKSNKSFNGLKYMHFYHIVRMRRQGVKDEFLGI